MKSSLSAVLGVATLAAFLLFAFGCAKKEQGPPVRSDAGQLATRMQVPEPAPEETTKASENKAPDPIAEINPLPAFEPVELNTYYLSRNMNSVDFSPDGKTLVATSSYGGSTDLKAWDLASGKEIPLPGEKKLALGGHVEFTPDGNLLVPVRGGQERREDIKVWNLATGKLTRTVPLDSCIMAIAISPDGKVIAWADLDEVVRVIDWSSGKETARLEGHTKVIPSLAFSPDSKLLVSGSFDKTIKVWAIATGKEKTTLTGHTEEVRSLVFTPDGKTLISSGNDKHVRLWDVESWKEKAQIEQPDTGPTLAITPDGKTLVTANFYRGVRLWDLATGKEIGKLHALHDGANHIAVSPNGKTLAVGHFLGIIKTFDLTQGVPVLAPRKTVSPVAYGSTLAVSSDGQRLGAIAGGSFTYWDLDTFEKRVTHNRINARSLSYDGKTIAASDSNSVKLLDATTGMGRDAVTGRFDDDSPVALSRDLKLLATGNADKTVTVWDVASGKPRASLNGFEWELKLLAFSPDGKLVAAGDGKQLKVWEWGTGKVKNDFEDRITCLAFSADGKLLAFGDTKGETDIWDIATDKSKATVCGHGSENKAVALSPDGKLLATASRLPVRYGATTTPLPQDNSEPVLRLWDATTGKPLAILHGHIGDVCAAVFSPDSKTLYSSGEDQTIKIWDIAALAPKPN